MHLNFLIMIALALSFDAFGVALSLGLNSKINSVNKIAFCFSFGYFQFLFSYLGCYFGIIFNKYFLALPKLIGGGIVFWVGVMMIKDGLQEKGNKFIITTKMYIILGASVSVDALIIGFTTFNSIRSHEIILFSTLTIGFITMLMTALAFIVSKKLKNIPILSSYADYLGGLILIAFGLKMMFI